MPNATLNGRPRLELPAPGGVAVQRMVSHLTSRELETLKLVAMGLPNKAIAAELFLSIKTVEKHRQQAMNKLHLHDGISLTHFALARGLVRNMFADEPNG